MTAMVKAKTAKCDYGHCENPFYAAFTCIMSMGVQKHNFCQVHGREYWDKMPPQMKETVSLSERPHEPD